MAQASTNSTNTEKSAENVMKYNSLMGDLFKIRAKKNELIKQGSTMFDKMDENVQNLNEAIRKFENMQNLIDLECKI